MKKQTTVKTVTKKQQRKKIVFTTLAVSAAGILGYFGWQYFKRTKDKKVSNTDAILQPTTPSNPIPKINKDVWIEPNVTNSSSQHTTKPTATDKFPLRRGSKGVKVKNLQVALIQKYGKNILPKYGADGDFGAELFAALKKLQLPISINATTYNVLVAGQVSSSNTTAQQLYQSVIDTNFKVAIALLKTIQDKDDYTTIGNQFKNFRINGVRQTLVNAMLNYFTTEEQKQAIRFEFIRMGLQYDGKQWSLSGLGGLPIITHQATTVWLNANTGVQVASKTVLGNEVSRKLDYTLFENKGRYFLVNTNATRYL